MNSVTRVAAAWEADLRAAAAGAVAFARIQARYPLQMAGLLVWPLLLPGVYVLQARAFAGGSGAASLAFAQRAGTGSVAGFLLVGFAMYMWISNVLWGPGTNLRQQQQGGQLEAMYLTPASRAAILYGPSAGFFVVSMLMFAVVGLATRFLFGVPITVPGALRALVVLAIAVPAMYGMAGVFAVAALVIRETHGMVQVLRGTFQVLSGLTFPIVVLPDWARSIALELPPTRALGALRAVLLSGAELAATGKDLVFLAAAGLLLCATGVVAFQLAERYARSTGGLAQY